MRRPRDAALCALVLVALFVGVRLLASDGRPGAFAVAGDQFVDASRAPRDLPVREGSAGYDGQFVYRLGLDPLTRQTTDYGITLDTPPYRQQRIGLPVLAWAVDRTTPLPLSVALIVVNALALVGAAGLGARFAQRHGRAPGWGVLVALSPALVIALARDLTEPFAWFALLAGLLAWTQGRLGLAVTAFSVAVLTRETSLVVLAGMGVWHLFHLGQPRSRSRALLLLIPLAVALSWQVWLRQIWGEIPVGAQEGNLTWPPFGVVSGLFELGGSWFELSRNSLLRHLWLLERLGLLVLVAVVATTVSRSRLPADLRAGWVLAAVLALSAQGWRSDVQFFRAAHEAIAVGLLVLLGTPGRRVTATLTGVAVTSGVVAIVYAALP